MAAWWVVWQFVGGNPDPNLSPPERDNTADKH